MNFKKIFIFFLALVILVWAFYWFEFMKHEAPIKPAVLPAAPSSVQKPVVDFDVTEFVKWYRASPVCEIKTFYKPCSWDQKDSCLDLDVFKKALEILRSKISLSDRLANAIQTCLDFHKQRNTGFLWDSPSMDEEIEAWKVEHPGEAVPENLGMLHWADGFDDDALSPVIMMHDQLCPEEPVHAYATVAEGNKLEMRLEFPPPNKVRTETIFSFDRDARDRGWDLNSIGTEVVQ